MGGISGPDRNRAILFESSASTPITEIPTKSLVAILFCNLPTFQEEPSDLYLLLWNFAELGAIGATARPGRKVAASHGGIEPRPHPRKQWPFACEYTAACVGTAVGDLDERAPSSSNAFSA
jgi:hypothetical protein